MKAIITGGGTGGHIYPAIAIAKGLKNYYKDIEILYIGTKKGLESELVPKSGISFKTITVRGFKRELSLDNIKTIKELLIGIGEARRIINDFKPDFVIGTGGYVCGPVVLVASLKKIKCAIHEQNVIPGITNRILGKFVDRIFVSFQDSKKYFNNKDKVFLTGNPIREEFKHINKLRCKTEMNVNEDSMTVLSFGGSRGAKKINETMLEVIKHINNYKDISLIHITGKYYYNEFISSLESSGVKLNSNIKILPYAHNMPTVMGAADLIISRAGAITIAEITSLGIPAILVPSPNVVNNHQEYNARILEKHDSAIMILEKNFNCNNLIDIFIKLKNNKNRLREMASNSRKLGITDATDKIILNIKKLIEK